MIELCLCRDGWPVLCVDAGRLWSIGGVLFLSLMLFFRIRQLQK